MIQKFLGPTSPALGQSATFDEVADALEQLPAKDAERLGKELDRCLGLIATGGAAGLLTGYNCIQKVYKEARAIIKAQEAAQDAPPTPPPKAPPPAAAAGSPYTVPIILGLIGLTGVGAYYAFKGKG